MFILTTMSIHLTLQQAPKSPSPEMRTIKTPRQMRSVERPLATSPRDKDPLNSTSFRTEMTSALSNTSTSTFMIIPTIKTPSPSS